MHSNIESSFVFACTCTALSYLFGINPVIGILLFMMSMDIIIGVVASFINEKLYFNSRKLCKGITKKFVLICLVAFAHQLDMLLKTDVIAIVTTYFYIANEGFSIIENAAKCGMVMPKILVNSLEQVKELSDIDKNKRH